MQNRFGFKDGVMLVLLIIVGVCMQTVAQIEGHLLTQHYDGLSEKKTRGGRRKRLSQNQQK